NAYAPDGGTFVHVCAPFLAAPRLPQPGAVELSKAGVAIHEASHMLIGPDLRDQSSNLCAGSRLDRVTHLPKCYGAGNAHAIKGLPLSLINPDNYAFRAEDAFRP